MSTPIERPTIGEPAPDMGLETATGAPWQLRDHRGKSVILIFHRHIH